MSILAKITDVLGGSLVGTIMDTVKDYFPPSMSDKEKGELSLRIQEAQNKRDIAVMEAASKADTEFNTRTKEMEGTANDLKTIPIVGAIVIFLRGMQRPVWGFATLYLDYKSFSGDWKLSEKQDFVLLAINILVLGFLFGERAVRNIAPLLESYFKK